MKKTCQRKKERPQMCDKSCQKEKKRMSSLGNSVLLPVLLLLLLLLNYLSVAEAEATTASSSVTNNNHNNNKNHNANAKAAIEETRRHVRQRNPFAQRSKKRHTQVRAFSMTQHLFFPSCCCCCVHLCLSLSLFIYI